METYKLKPNQGNVLPGKKKVICSTNVTRASAYTAEDCKERIAVNQRELDEWTKRLTEIEKLTGE